MSSDAIEREPTHLETISTIFPSMPTLDVSSEPIFKPIFDLDDSPYALKSHNDPRNPPKGSMKDQEEQ
jgi:hypothetical protein